RGTEQEGVRVQLLFFLGGELGKHLRLGRFKDAIETPEHRKGQDDLAIVGLLVVTAQKVGDRPDERRQSMVIHVGPPSTELKVAQWGNLDAERKRQSATVNWPQRR